MAITRAKPPRSSPAASRQKNRLPLLPDRRSAVPAWAEGSRVSAGCSARGLSRSPLTPSHDGKGDQKNHDSDGTNDVRHHGKGTSDIARVRPDESNNHSHHKQNGHSGEPVEDPSLGDATDPKPVKAFRQSKRQTLLLGRGTSASSGVSPASSWRSAQRVSHSCRSSPGSVTGGAPFQGPQVGSAAV